MESQDFVFWAFDPPPNGEFPGNFPLDFRKKFEKKTLEIQDPNPAVVLEAAVAADREWGVWVGEAPPQKV